MLKKEHSNKQFENYETRAISPCGALAGPAWALHSIVGWKRGFVLNVYAVTTLLVTANRVANV